MFDSAGLPPYPPPRNVWEYPPPPVQKRWLWITIAATVLSLGIAATMGVRAIMLGNDDYPGLIDDSELISVISDQCDQMTATVESMRVTGEVEQQSSIIRSQDSAIRTMLEGIRLDAALVARDRPAEAWLHDWDRLLEAREDYRRLLIIREPTDLVVPRDADGTWIVARMDDVFVDSAACTVPDVLLYPYPNYDPDGDPDSDV